VPDAADNQRTEPHPATAGQRLTALLARGMIRTLGRTLRLASFGNEHLERARAASPSGRVVFAFWHGRQFGLVYEWRDRDVAVMSSLSRDGTLQGMILGGLGYHIVRGSSSRGAVRGLVGMIRSVRESRDAAFAVDGPRGPYHEVKPGVLYLAAKTGLPIVPITSAMRHARIFEKAWDRYVLPFPFTRGVVGYGPALFVPEDSDENALLTLSRELGQRIDAITEEAESSIR
jgi:lysophospholipid acyltransferase (LPLAT)-like uncharacterized protein